jgi:hypothetical protein
LQANYRSGLVTYLELLVADVQLHQVNIATCRHWPNGIRTPSRCSWRWAAAGGTEPMPALAGLRHEIQRHPAHRLQTAGQ